MLQKFHFPVEVLKGPGASFPVAVFVEFFDEIIYFEK